MKLSKTVESGVDGLTRWRLMDSGQSGVVGDDLVSKGGGEGEAERIWEVSGASGHLMLATA